MLVRNTLWSFGAQVVRLVTALLLIAMLDPAARGLQSLLILLPSLIAVLSLLGVGSATPVVLYRGADEQRLLGTLVSLGCVVIACVGLVLVPLLPFIARYLSDPQQYVVGVREVVIGLLFFPPTLMGDYLRAFLAARRDLRRVALSQAAQAVSQLVLALVLVVGLGAGPLGAVWATVASGWIGCVAAARAAQNYGSLRPRWSWAILSPMWSLGLRAHAGNIVQTFNYRLDALLVQGFIGQAAVGLYQTAVTLAEMVWYLPNAVSVALVPEVAATGKGDVTPRAVRHTLALTVLGALALVAVAWPALWFVRPAYSGALVPMCVLLVGVVALSVHKVVSGDLLGQGLPQYPTYTSAVALVVTLVGDVVLIPRWGILGAAVASTLAYTIQTVLLLWLYRRVRTWNWRELLVPQRGDAILYRRLIGRLRRG
jgi:O-antigen/teichoic acid export membrane protein